MYYTTNVCVEAARPRHALWRTPSFSQTGPFELRLRDMAHLKAILTPYNPTVRSYWYHIRLIDYRWYWYYRLSVVNFENLTADSKFPSIKSKIEFKKIFQTLGVQKSINQWQLGRPTGSFVDFWPTSFRKNFKTLSSLFFDADSESGWHVLSYMSSKLVN